MKLSFHVLRPSWFRTLGPIIEAAIRDSDIEASILYDPKEQPTDGSQSDWTPECFRENIRVEVFESEDRFIRALNDSGTVVSILGKGITWDDSDNKVHAPKWHTVFDGWHSATIHKNGFLKADLNFWPTQFQLEAAIKRYPEHKAALTEKARIVGMVRNDQYKTVSKQETYDRYGMDPDRPVVLMVPDLFYFQTLPGFMSDYYKYLWCTDNIFVRLFGAVFKVRAMEAVKRALDPNFGYTALIKSLRRFCDHNNAQLVFAERRPKEWKDKKYSAAEMAAADHIISDDQHYPHPMMRILAISDLAMDCQHSFVVAEAVAADVPFLVPWMPMETVLEKWQFGKEEFVERYARWPGAVWLQDTEKLVSDFPEMTFDDFTTNQESRAGFMNEFTGPVDGQCSTRLLSEIKACQSDGANAAVCAL